MRELSAIYIIWVREIKRYLRERSRIVSSVVTPLLWLLIFGTGLGSIGRVSGGLEYRAYIFPGIIGMTLLFTSIWSGISVIWDREFGFLKEILVAPIARTSIVIGKALGGATCASIPGIILISLSSVVGVHLGLVSYVLCILLMLLIAIGLVSIGLVIASQMESMEGFNMVMSFVVMPMFFLSGALFPIDNVPEWLRIACYFNPLTYGVDALHGIIFGRSIFPIYYNVLVLLGFTFVMITINSIIFNIKK